MDNFKNLQEESPEYFAAFQKFLGESEKEGALSVKVKELISVALGITSQCTFCIAIHVKKAADAGATKQELIEAGMVAGLMGGGPAVCYLKYLFDAIDQLGIE
ncbi:MAG: carboxymuconolactone decarboxylase family protein [Actinomycetia bacterium]|nr:carboxymuconolactone decarboxylase family protein [Actinomycetes bacterium]